MRQGVVGNHQPDHVIGTKIDDHIVAQREDMAVLVGSDRDPVDLIARMRGGGEILTAVFDPAHRSAQGTCGEGDQGVLDRLYAFLAKAATDIAGDHTNLTNRHAQRIGNDSLQHMRGLGACPYGQRLPERIGLRKHTTRLHGGCDIAMRAKLLLDDDLGRGKHLVGVTFAGGDR